MYCLTKFQIPPTMPINAMAFFNEVFGWTFQQQGNQTYLSATADASPFQIVPLQEDTAPTIGTIRVKDVDRMMRKVQREGGEIVIPKKAVPGIGWLAYCKGPGQHIFSLMQPDALAA